MRPIIRTALVLLATLAVASCSHSADSSGSADNAVQPGSAGAMSQGGPARMHRFQRVLESLNLTDAQKTQIKQIMADTRAKNTDADPETRKSNFKDAMAKIDTVLTPEQRTEFHAKMQAMRRPPASDASSPQPDASSASQ